MAYLEHGKIYAFDFDGTLCQEAYPGIGKPNKAMIRYAKKLKEKGNRLILWTCRNGQPLEHAIAWCQEQGLEFDAVNQNLPEILKMFGSDSRKITADYYVDDRLSGISLLLFTSFFCSSNRRKTKYNQSNRTLSSVINLVSNSIARFSQLWERIAL